MNKEKPSQSNLGNINPVAISSQQKNYLDDGTYCLNSLDGRPFKRIRKLMALNPFSGNILVKEKVCCNDYNYEKVFVITPDGRPEKFKGLNL